MREVIAQLYEKVELKPGVRDTLARLRAEGARMCVCSNTWSSQCRTVLTRLGIDEYFDFYIEARGAMSKSSPAPFMEALHRLGVKHLYPVEEQMVLDGNFPTVKSPNPENPEGFYLAIDLAKKVDSDLIIGTDPDSDRIGVLARRNGEYIPITGNQMGCLLLDYIINARRAAEIEERMAQNQPKFDQ